MEINNLTIIPPEGMEAYQEGNEIKFRVKTETAYGDIAYKLFRYKTCYSIDEYGSIVKFSDGSECSHVSDLNNCTSKKQAQKLLAINQLMNIAKYFNEDWKPDWSSELDDKYYIYIVSDNIGIARAYNRHSDIVYFKSEKLAERAIKILGKEVIKLALSTDW